MIDMDMIRDLTNAFGPSGFEEEVVRVIGDYCKGMHVANDAMNNVYAWPADKDDRNGTNVKTGIKPGEGNLGEGRNKPVIMLDAHTDECGFMVQGIMDNGLLSMIMLGGMDLASLPAHTVLIRTGSGKKVRGIITSRPVHFMTDKEKNAPLDIQEIYMDVGASSKDEAIERYGIRIGDPAAPEVSFDYDGEHQVCFGKAFDNRMGCACIIHTMRELQRLDQELAVDVVGAFAAQEEVGMRGASVTAARVQPDLAIVFEGSPADDFYYGKERAQGIMDNGLLSMIMLGGMDLASLPAHTVLIRTGSGKKVRGIITSRPVHFMTDKEKNAPLDIQEIYMDVGASSKDEAIERYGIRIGDPAAPEVSFDYDGEHQVCFGKAFDNRMGCACIIHTMRELQRLDQELAVDVVGAFAAQEEVGMRGASVTAARVQPDLAIVFEGSPADDFYYGKERAQGIMRGGVQIRCMDKSYITNPAFLRYAHELGEREGIPYQDTVRRGGSTNAGKISLAGKAVPTLVLGIPSRYVHSHYNFCAEEDIAATVRMAVEVIRNLDSRRIGLLMHRDI